MTDILVDPDRLRWGAAEIERVAGEADAAVRDLNIPTLVEGINPEYAVQLATKVRGYGAQLVGQTAPVINGLREHSTWLRELARRFEEADQASVQGMERLWASTQALISDYGESPFVPMWLLDGTCPPWMDTDTWRQLDPDDRLAMMAYLRREWANFLASRTEGSFRSPIISAGYLEEMFMIYMFGLPLELFQDRQVTDREGNVITIRDQTAPYLPEHDLFSKPVLPDVREVYDFDHWQYQNLPDMMQGAKDKGYLPTSADETIWGDWSPRHLNLCGQDAAGHAVGVDHMAESYLAFAEVWEPALIHNEAISPYHLAHQYEQLGWQADILGPFKGSELHWDAWTAGNPHVVPGMEEVNAYLREGYSVTPLVGVSNGPGGALSSTDAAVGHYVNILERFTTRDGVEVVRVYNPIDHQEEIYTWEHLEATWGKWENIYDNGAGQAVIARAGQDG